MGNSEAPLRLAELVAALSIASDLGTGHPLERALRACLFGVRLGDASGCDDATLADIYYVTLLRFAGCAADAQHRASLFDDEIALGPDIDAVELWKVEPMIAFLRKTAGNSLPQPERDAKLQWALREGVQRSVEAAQANCDIAQSMSLRLGLSFGVRRGLGDIFERWDGGGVPGKAKGEALSLPARAATLALDLELFHRRGGLPAAFAVARERAAGQYDPRLVDVALKTPGLFAAFDEADPWTQALSEEPGPQLTLSADQREAAMRTIADFSDLRLPWFTGHSTAVADLCDRAARNLHMPAADVTRLRHAGYAHDVGASATSVSVWGKPGPLSVGEWERARLHPYYTERILARSAALAPIGALASLHHERLDGSGYHRGLTAAMLSQSAQILAAAECYQGMIEARPHRAAFEPSQAEDMLAALSHQGALETSAVRAVLHAAGHSGNVRTDDRVGALPAGLTSREVEVLRLLAKGTTNKNIATVLTLAPATVDHHIRHIYNKIGCSSRIAATMFAMEHRLV